MAIPLEHLPLTAQVYRQIVTDGADDWNGPSYSATPTCSVRCLISPMEPRDEALVVGITDEKRMLMFALPDANIQKKDRLVINGTEYEIDTAVITIMNPIDWSNHHKECRIIEREV